MKPTAVSCKLACQIESTLNFLKSHVIVVLYNKFSRLPTSHYSYSYNGKIH